MNLYKITFGHAAPKDWAKSILGYVLADNDEQVYEYIKSEPEINGHSAFNGWQDNEDEGNTFEVFNDQYDVIGTESFKEKIIRLKGEVNDEDYDFSDSYYGISLYGWELVCENPSGLEGAIAIGIIHQCK